MRLKIIQNPDKEYFEKISQAVKDNNLFCPCCIEQTSDTLCICKDFKFQQEVGFCLCKRYLKVPMYYTNDELQKIIENSN